MRRLAILAAALGVLWPWAPSEARPAFVPGTLDLEYEITASGFVLARTRFTLVLDADAFDFKLTVEPGGVPSIFTSFKLRSQADGLKTGALIAPRRYRSQYLKQDRLHRSVKIDYGGNDISAVLADPTPKEDKRPPLTEPLAAGTLDPLSAALVLLQEVAASGRCQGARQVYDGRRLFRVQVREPTGLIPIAGQPVSLDRPQKSKLLCRVAIGRIAGFREKEIVRQRYPELLLAELAPAVPGAPWVPVRLTVEAPETGFGTKAATLVSATWRERYTKSR
jgi:hypothetical protein